MCLLLIPSTSGVNITPNNWVKHFNMYSFLFFINFFYDSLKHSRNPKQRILIGPSIAPGFEIPRDTIKTRNLKTQKKVVKNPKRSAEIDL